MVIRTLTMIAVSAGLLMTAGCAGPNQRLYYREAIAKFHGSNKRLPTGKELCWLAPDLVGGSAGSNVIAEEEFTHYLIKKNLCRVIEKHPDAAAGYTWPQTDVCPCPPGTQSCQAQCDGKPAEAAGGPAAGLGGFGLSSAAGGKPAPEGHDNNRSNDKLLERYKKSTIPDKIITYRIDELNKEKAVIHFRVANAKKDGEIEQSEVITVYPRPAGGSDDSE